MTPDQFTAAALLLQERGIIVSGHGWKTDLADKLGLTRQSVDKFVRQGTKQIQTDYAIEALLLGVQIGDHKKRLYVTDH